MSSTFGPGITAYFLLKLVWRALLQLRRADSGRAAGCWHQTTGSAVGWRWWGRLLPRRGQHQH